MAALFLLIGFASAGHGHKGVNRSLSFRKQTRALIGSDEEAVAVDDLHKAKKNLASAKATLDAAKAEVYAEGGEIDKDGNVIIKEEDSASLRGSRSKTAVSPPTEVTSAAKDESYEQKLGEEGKTLTREFDDINKALDQMDQDIDNGDYDGAKQDEDILNDLGTATEETEETVTLIEKDKQGGGEGEGSEKYLALDESSSGINDEQSVSAEEFEGDKIEAKIREEDNLIIDQEIVLDAEVHETGKEIKALRDAVKAKNSAKAQEIKAKMGEEESQELGVKAKIEFEQENELKLAKDEAKVDLLNAKIHADDEEIQDQEIVLTAEIKKTDKEMKALQQAKKAGEKARVEQLEDKVALEEEKELLVESKIESEEAEELELQEEEEELENGASDEGVDELEHDSSERV